MAPRFGTRPVVASRSPRRKTAWLASPDETALTGVAAAGVDFQGSLNAAALALRPFTIVRARGIVWVESDQIASIESPFGAFGMAVVSDQSVAAGVASLPSPITDEGSDLWFMYQHVATNWRFNTSGASPGNVYQFDSKAMRKVGIGQDIVLMFENADGSFGIRYVAKYRILVKLH